MVHRWKIHLFTGTCMRSDSCKSKADCRGMGCLSGLYQVEVSHPGAVGQSGMEDTVMTCAAS